MKRYKGYMIHAPKGHKPMKLTTAITIRLNGHVVKTIIVRPWKEKEGIQQAQEWVDEQIKTKN